MWIDTPLLLRQAMRQAISETLNTHRPGKKQDIALIGSRRSGSTLLMQVLGHAPGLKSSDQPFAPPTATAAQMRHLGWPAGGIFVAPDAAMRARLLRLVRRTERTGNKPSSRDGSTSTGSSCWQ